MENSRSSDRLSELPDSLIFNMFEFLSMNDVVKTAILSKRWKDLWTTVPFLEFQVDRPDAEMVRYFVNQALKLWRGIKILKFTINFRHINFVRDVFDDDLNVWVLLAKEKQVEEVHLRICIFGWESYELSECLYSCSPLKVLVLSLGGIRLWPIDGNIKWDSLKSLTIDLVYFDLDPEFISQALRGSPNLEVFNLTLHELESEVGSVFIQSSSLKKLSIRKPVYETDKDLKIVTPNLECLLVFERGNS